MHNSGVSPSSAHNQKSARTARHRNTIAGLVLAVAVLLSVLHGLTVTRLLVGTSSAVGQYTAAPGVVRYTSTEGRRVGSSTDDGVDQTTRHRKKPKPKKPKTTTPKKKPKSPRKPTAQPLSLKPKGTPSTPTPTTAREADPVTVEDCYTEDDVDYCDKRYELGGVQVSDTKVRAVYTVNGDTISGQTSPRLDSFARKVWSRFITLVPPETRNLITSFELHEPNESGAYVIKNPFGRAEGARESWTFGVMTDMDPNDMDFVLIHEAGHIVTMKEKFTDAKLCSTLVDTDDNSCSLPTSFASKFAAKFWTADMIARAERNPAKLWAANKAQFVDDYAATNPFEDMAETFAYFVLDMTADGSVARDKIAMFAADPAMAALKSQILARQR